MDIQRQAFEESNNVNPDWSFKFDEELQQYIAVDFEMTNQVDEFNEHWDTFRAGWQAAKAKAVPDGFVAFPKKQTSRMRTLARDFDARLSLTKYEQLHNIWVKQAMIEAQEPAK